MDEAFTQRILNMPEYQELLRRRRSINIPLVIVMLASYFGFILAIAFYPDVLSLRIGSGVITLGLALGLGLIILTFSITGIFIHRTDKISALLIDIRKKAMGE